MEGGDDYWQLLEKKKRREKKRIMEEKEDDNNNRSLGIPPSDVPSKLPIVSEEELLERQVTVITPEEIPEIWMKVRKEREDEIDEESDMEEKRSWKRSRGESERESCRKVVQRNIFCISSDEDDEEEKEEPRVAKKRDRKAECPIMGCEWKTQKLRNHVNKMHLPKAMWDNHCPPVKPTKFHQLNNIRGEVLLFLAKKLVNSDSILDLMQWCANKNNFIPKRAVAIGRHIEQMRSLTTTMGWARPSYNRYQLWPPNHTSVLIHWRYQVAFLKELQDDDIRTYMNFGREFMNDPSNLAKIDKNAPPRPATRTEPRWDESQEIPQETEKMVTKDVCGEPDEVTTMEVVQQAEETIERRVIIGENHYQLVLRGASLSIHADHRRQSTVVEPKSQEKTQARQITEAYPVFDSHFHLDRSSLRLIRDVSLSVETWLEEQMERPPTVPVNVMGGMLIYCDPDTYPNTVPIDGKWLVAVGVHPKKVQDLTEDQCHQFVELIKSARVAAVGEIGMDRTISERFWDQQLRFLERMAPHIKKVKKPIILHVRSNRYDRYSQLLYLVILKFCSNHFLTNQKIILHCFTGTDEIQQAWLSQFPNTFFGFTYMVSKFDSQQSTALRAIPSNRLLIETDSPYITPQGITTNSPIYLGEVAEVVAKQRRDSIEEICRLTTINSTTVFGQKKGSVCLGNTM